MTLETKNTVDEAEARSSWLVMRRRDRRSREELLQERCHHAHSLAEGCPVRPLLGQRAAQLLERLVLQAGDVHLRDVEAPGDLRLRDRLVEAQEEDEALAPREHLEGPLEIGAVFEELQAGSSACRCSPPAFAPFLSPSPPQLGVEREQVVGLARVLALRESLLPTPRAAWPARRRSATGRARRSASRSRG